MKNIFLLCALLPFFSARADQHITMVNHEYEGTKQWLPGTIIAQEGETVHLTLINKVPSGIHGFSIPDFQQKVEVKKGETKEISFVADKSGLFPIICHLHKAHVGGQLLVLPKGSPSKDSSAAPKK